MARVSPRRRSPWPAAMERQLAARLRRRVRVIRAVVLEQLHAARHDSARSDSVFGVRAMGPRMRLAVRQSLPITPASLGPTAHGIDTTVTAAVAHDLERDPPEESRSTEPALREWARTTAARVEEAEGALVDRALAAAEGTDDPERAARDALASAEIRAGLLARDAVGDLVADVTRTRARELGSEGYIWRTQEDERVRPAHAQRDGDTFRWDDPPEDGAPGEPRMCRCWAQPVAAGAPAVGAPAFAPIRLLQGAALPPAASESPRGLVEGRKRAPPTPIPDPFVGTRLWQELPAPPRDLVIETRRQIVRAIEAEIRHHAEEHCGTLLSDGTILRSGPEESRDLGIVDTRISLRVPDAQLRQIQDDGDAIFTHTHPGTATFSPKDLKFAADLDVAEMRATHRDGGAWTVRRPEGGWSDPEEIRRELTETAIEAQKRAMMKMDDFIVRSGGDPRDEKLAKGWSDAVADRIGDDEYNAAIRDALGRRGIPLEFDP